MTELNEDEMVASSLACLLAVLQGDTEGVSELLNSMTWAELRFVAQSALQSAADGVANGRNAPSPEQLAMQITELKARIAALRASAMQTG